MPNPHVIVLTGLKHSGKSTVAQALSQVAPYELCQLDDEIARRCGEGTVTDAYRAIGRRHFRRLEFALLRDCVRAATATTEQRNWVIDCGGGAIAYGRSRRLLRRLATRRFVAATPDAAAHRAPDAATDNTTARALYVVYLRADAETVMRRFIAAPDHAAPDHAAPDHAPGSSLRTGSGDAQPAFLQGAHPHRQWRRLSARRARSYAALRAITVDSDALLTPLIHDPRALCNTILECIAQTHDKTHRQRSNDRRARAGEQNARQ